MNKSPTSDSIAATIDAYLERHPQWQSQLTALRRTLQSAGLEETVKWGMPSYTLEGKVVASIAGFKQHCALWLHNGVFLKDPDQVLVNAAEGRTRGLRQWRFAADEKVPAARVKAYIREAIANQKAGRKIVPRTRTLLVPPELEAALSEDPQLQKAFAALTPGRQREYASHIDQAKQSQTRLSRLKTALPKILAGQGLNDKYR